MKSSYLIRVSLIAITLNIVPSISLAQVITYNGTPQNDFFSGTLLGEADFFGMRGVDQINYEGFASDYTFTRNQQRIKVLKANGNFDVLDSIEGIYFTQQAEFFSITAMLNGGVEQSPVIYQGTPQRDVFYGYIEIHADFFGAGDFDQVNYEGTTSDYVFEEQGNGQIHVIKPGGEFDILDSIEGVYFFEQQDYFDIDELLSSGSQGDNFTKSITLDPAEIRTFRLEELNLPENLEVDQGSSGDLNNGTPEILVRNGNLVIATPGDTGQDQLFNLNLSNASGDTVNLEIVTPSSRPLTINPVYDNITGESPETTIAELRTAVVTGITGAGLLSNDLSITAVGAPIFSPTWSRFTIVNETSNTFIDANGIFAFDSSSNTFTADLSDLQTLLSQEAPSASIFTLSADLIHEGTFLSDSYDVKFITPKATLNGQLVDSAGNPISSSDLTNLNVAAIGRNSNIRRVVPVDISGQFQLDNLLSESYRLFVVDLEQPTIYSGAVGILDSSTTVSLDLLYEPLMANQSSRALSSSDFQDGLKIQKSGPTYRAESFKGEAPIQNGRKSPEDYRNLPTRLKHPFSTELNKTASGNCVILNGDTTIFSVRSEGEGSNNSCMLDFIADDTAVGLNIEVEVNTAEFPQYTTQGSQFNDEWSFSLSSTNSEEILDFNKDGSVNDTHGASGTIKFSKCIKAPVGPDGTIDLTNPVIVSGNLSSTNIADGFLQTEVKVSISEGCSLGVEEAKFETPSNTGPLIEPVNIGDGTSGNLEGRYVSIQTQSPDGLEYSLPLKIKYLPKDATITEAKISLVSGGSVLATSDNIIGGGVIAENGEINISSFILPVFSNIESDVADIAFAVQLLGVDDGITVETDLDAVNVTFKDKNSFEALYLAENDITASARRYGQGFNEPGDDNWATPATIDYLESNQYRFNDISAQHITQLGNGRSILSHAGHSDGTQIDFRYQSPDGNFGDFGFGGRPTNNAITALILSAQAERDDYMSALDVYNEAISNNQTPPPAIPSPTTTEQQKLFNWVTFNRSLLEIEATNARRIYHGNGNHAAALMAGAYPNEDFIIEFPINTDQNGVPSPQPLGTWADRPINLRPVRGHLDHWHISLNPQ